MLVYLTNLVFVYITSFCAREYSSTKQTNLLGEKKPNILLFYLALISMILVAGLRYETGTDFWTYRTIFNIQSNDSIFSILTSNEGLFWLIGRIISVFTDNTAYIFFIYAFIIIFLISKTIFNYSTFLELSMFLYIATMDYYSSFNGIRQWTAAAILFYFSKYIYQGNFRKYLLVVLIATYFHNSAILMLPIYFLVRRKPGSKIILITVLLSVLMTLVFPNVITILSEVFEGNSYQKYLITDLSDDGVHPLRVLVAMVPILFSIIGYKFINKNKKVEIDVWINFSLLNLLTLFMATQNTFFARISFYFSTYNVLLIPLILRTFDSKSKRILYLLIIIFYLIYMVLLLPKESNLLPYKTIFGHIFQ